MELLTGTSLTQYSSNNTDCNQQYPEAHIFYFEKFQIPKMLQ